jgi:hypothetical protein
MSTPNNEITEAKETIAKLEAQVASLTKQLEDAKAKTQYLDSSGKVHKRMSEMAEKMLALIAESHEPPFRSQVIGSFGLSKAKGELVFDELWRNRVIDRNFTKSDGDHNCYSTPAGRAYLAAVGLL